MNVYEYYEQRLAEMGEQRTPCGAAKEGEEVRFFQVFGLFRGWVFRGTVSRAWIPREPTGPGFPMYTPGVRPYQFDPIVHVDGADETPMPSMRLQQDDFWCLKPRE